VADAVRIATEVASALDYAHRHQVVHRDIKPENILLHDGRALVADFGIALAASKASGSRMTETGMSLGTPQYMSPEQAMGEREVTARSDVYALGAVLYEMLTGDPPFSGSTAQAIVARVVTETPRPLVPQRHTIPPHVEATVLTALEKLPADRYATAAEFAAALTGPGRVSSAMVPAAPVSRRAHTRRPLATVLAWAVAALATLTALWGWLRPTAAAPVSRFSLFLRDSERLQSLAGISGGRLAVSPEGRRLVYVGPSQGGSQLWLRRLDQLQASPISGTAGGASPFFSPDGRQLGFVSRGRIVRIVSLEGGPPITLTSAANTTGADWGADGYVYFEVDSGIARVRATGGALEPVFTISPEKQEIATEWPSVLPGGRGLLFRLRHTGQGPDDFEVLGMKLPKGDVRVLTRGIYARYAASGHLLVVTADGKLLAIPFDPDELALTGSPVALVEGLAVGNAGFGIDLALSPTGTLVYTTGSGVAARRAVWVDRDGTETPVDPGWDPQGTISSIALSPDGKSLAVGLERAGKEDIWIKQLPAGPFSRITFGDTAHVRPAWSADGSSVIYVSDRAGTNSGLPLRRRADGTGSAKALLSSPFNFSQVLESRDGRWLVLRRSGGESGAGDIHGLRAGDTALTPLVTTAASEGEPALSPDGRWLAYASDESGTFEVYVRPFPDVSSARWQVSTTGGGEPVWSPNGRELYYRNGRNQMIAAALVGGPGFTVGEQRELFSTAPYLDLGFAQSYGVSPDGRRFVLVREAAPSQESELILVENWLRELQARTRQ
jgi:serine/threonine-protein kinase